MAYASGLNPKREQLAATLALAMVVAISIKVVGALLIAALLLIPAAAARPSGRPPRCQACGPPFDGAPRPDQALLVPRPWPLRSRSWLHRPRALSSAGRDDPSLSVGASRTQNPSELPTKQSTR